MIKLKTLTQDSWLVIDDQVSHYGLLNRRGKDQYSLLYSGKKHSFDKKSLISYLGQDPFKNVDEVQISSDIENVVIGYPTDSESVFPAHDASNLPLYTKSETSEVKYAAGYYCVKYPFNWVQCFCPKYSTLKQYEFSGPFKTETENKAMLSKLRKDARDQKAKK